MRIAGGKKVLGKSQNYEVRKFLPFSRNSKVIDPRSKESKKNVFKPRRDHWRICSKCQPVTGLEQKNVVIELIFVLPEC